MKLFMMPAPRKNQKFCATAEIKAGTVQEMRSKTRVVSLRPSLSVITPLERARTN